MFEYPKDVAQKLDDALGAAFVGLPQLDRFVEVLFCASMFREEGHVVTFSVVYPGVYEEHHPTPERVHGYAPWQAVDFQRPVDFDPMNAAKLASLAASEGEHLIVHFADPKLIISGIGDIREFPAFSFERKLLTARVIAPGVVRFFSGDREVLTYASGAVSRPPRWPFASAHVAMDDLVSAMANMIEISPAKEVVSVALSRLCAELIRRGHGGIIAIGGNDDAELEQTEAKRLRPSLEYGRLFAASWEASAVASRQEDLTSDEDRFEEERARGKSDHAVGLIGRMSTIDGAVLLTPELAAIGFGAKLAAPGPTPEVKRMSPAGSLEDFEMSNRGTRHRSAACFVAGANYRIALIASADGDTAAMFRSNEGHVLYWPVRDRYGAFGLLI